MHAGIPIPDKVTERRGDDTRWPFEIMEVGDSFDEPNPGDFDRVRGKASMWGYQRKRKFATRILQRAGQMNCPVCRTSYPVPPQFVIRIWRVE